LLAPLATDARLVTILDGAPAALSWIGGVCGHRVSPLGTERFGQTGDLPDLYRHHRLDVDAMIDAMAELCLERFQPSAFAPAGQTR
jgi:pyruvate dehydrogenase E1 component